jgi:hypothetical protein
LVPKRWYSWDYTVVSRDRTIAVLDLPSRERAEITIGGVTHHVLRERAMGGDFVIETGGILWNRHANNAAA